jgi:DNA-binding response OmpR family regulator
LRVFVNRVRQKLEPDPAHPRYLHTVTGLGLVFKLAQGGLDTSEDTSPQ